MKKYQKLLNKLINKDYSAVTKLNLLYEINCRFDCEIDDNLLNEFYLAYLENKNYNCVFDFVMAIQNWCIENETDFDLIENYDAMLKEIY